MDTQSNTETKVVVELPKPKFGPGRCQICGKPIVASTGEVGDTCKGHIGHIREFATEAAAIPEGYIGMSKVCIAFINAGFRLADIMKACGNDATTAPVLDEVFRPCYVGKRKYLNPAVLTKGMELLRAHLNSASETKVVAPAKADKAVADTANALRKHAVVKAETK
jgi:hypothetical protein